MALELTVCSRDVARMVSCAFPAVLGRCRKDHFLEGCCPPVCGEPVGSGWSSSVKPHCKGPAWHPWVLGPDVTDVPLDEGPVQGDGMQTVGPLFQGPAHAPNLFHIPTAAPCPSSGCGHRSLPLAGEGLTGLHQAAARGGSAAGTAAPCQASNGSCARRENLGLGVSLPYLGICPVCGVSTAPGAAVGTQAWCHP